MTVLHVKNMVCNRCIYMVDHLLKEAGIVAVSVKLGEIELAQAPSADALAVVETKLREFGFELLNDQKSRIIEKIKTTVIEYIQRVKVEYAKKQLELSEKNINEIIYELGYNDINAFRKVFRKNTDLSPADYRKKYNLKG